MDEFVLYAFASHAAWVQHTCGAAQPVETLGEAVRWATDHHCEAHPVGITPLKEES